MDLVKKLRARKAFVLNGTWMMLNQPDVDCEDAACEIERLRAEIQDLKASIDICSGSCRYLP